MFAYALSAALHVFAFAFFILRALVPTGATELKESTTQSVAFTQDRAVKNHGAAAALPTQAPVIARPTPVTQRTYPPPPVATLTPKPRPVVTPRTIVRRARFRPHPRVARAAPKRPELAKIVAHAPTQAERIAVLAPIVTAPPTREPSPVPTLAPTDPPTIAPRAATAPPTLAPTSAPTIAPTIAATIAPTVAPTIAPTAKPTPAPTLAPTERPTSNPTAVPTSRPTIAPTERATTRLPIAPQAIDAAAIAAAAVAREAAEARAQAEARRIADAKAAADAKADAVAKSAADAKRAADAAGDAAAARAKSTAAASSAAGPAGANAADPSARTPIALATPSNVANRPLAGPLPGAQSSGGNLVNLNSRLNASLPQGAPVTYGAKHYTNDIKVAIEAAQAEYYAAAAPPPAVLAKVIKVVKQGGTPLDGGSPAIVYILKRQRIFGIEICTGWKVQRVPGSTHPQGGYTFGPCGGEEFTPEGGLPTAPPQRGG